MTTRAELLDVDLQLELRFVGAQVVVVEVIGDLDVATLPVLQMAVGALPDSVDLEVDLHAATFVGIRPLGWLHDVEGARRQVAVRIPPPGLVRLLRRAGMGELVTVPSQVAPSPSAVAKVG